MLFKSVTLAALASAVSVVAQEISAADMVSNINRLTTLTRIATSITQTVVYVHNAPENRNDTIAIIDAIGTQGTLDQDLMTGHACGALTKRYSGSIAGRAMLGQREGSSYTPEEQTNVTDAYTTVSCSAIAPLPYHTHIRSSSRLPKLSWPLASTSTMPLWHTTQPTRWGKLSTQHWACSTP